MNTKILKFLLGICVACSMAPQLNAQDLEAQLIGEWKMDLRVLKYPGVEYHQEDASLFISEQMPDGTFRIISSITTRAVAERPELLLRPECEGKTECFYDDASEGIGRIIDGKLFIDWISEGWIDDVFTIAGNAMTGDDGNGLIRFTKKD